MSRKVAARKSRIHGNGVFAVAALSKGERIIQYKGACGRMPKWMPTTPAMWKAGTPFCLR